MIENPVFISVSGAHLFGIPNPTDVDLRGAHLLNETHFWLSWGRKKPKHCVEKMYQDVDFVSQEIGAYLKELVKPNVNFIEQVLSPLSIVRSKWYPELQEISRDCISKAMYSHWKGFAMHTSYHAVQEDYKKAKRNLYLLRIYYQGIFVARNERLRSDFDSFRELDCFNDELVQELFDCKKRSVDFFNKQNFLTHCKEIEDTLQLEIEKSKLREAPSKETKSHAEEYFKRVYMTEYGWK